MVYEMELSTCEMNPHPGTPWSRENDQSCLEAAARLEVVAQISIVAMIAVMTIVPPTELVAVNNICIKG